MRTSAGPNSVCPRIAKEQTKKESAFSQYIQKLFGNQGDPDERTVKRTLLDSREDAGTFQTLVTEQHKQQQCPAGKEMHLLLLLGCSGNRIGS
ncbi:hypothetical protein UY3_06790 [Chelonia mydas]|uniref:Uncharacterized protein n=1 Tax=Chelonia mydas TaxID=8469 RepID=M7BFS5_CHEMY|nr:hypothetical protein UY3_06790 [Chelonia mydas]